MNWLRVIATSACITSFITADAFPGRQPSERCSVTFSFTAHASREEAIEAEVAYRKASSHGSAWRENWMEWSGRYQRGVVLVHGESVEELTFEPKTKTVTKTVEEPDGERPVTKAIPKMPSTLPD
jgi:hypothetical protein